MPVKRLLGNLPLAVSLKQSEDFRNAGIRPWSDPWPSCDNDDIPQSPSRMKRFQATIAIVLFTCACSRPDNESGSLTVSVAASLQNAMTELGPAFERAQPGTRLSFNFGGSGTLAQQIERGAPADVFLSSAPKPMDSLAQKGLILPDTRHDLVRNQIVLIASKNGAGPNSFEDLAGAKVKLLALGDPGSVPAGDYGRQVLQSLHLWESVQPKLVLAKDVRQVLTYVETGNAEAGIVYSTDARESGKVRVAAVAPDGSHEPVVYPVAVVKGSRDVAAARALIAYLVGAGARDVFVRHGFTTVAP
jgi:molybdate transport system substrate-binding protein